MTVTDKCLIACAIGAVLGALLHLAMPLGGPAWYTFFGAPASLARLAARGHWYPVFTCVVIASLLLLCAGYALSGAGAIGRWPLLAPALGVIGGVLVLRGLVFIPLVVWRPDALASITHVRSVNGFMISTSALCLAAGLAYLAGCRQLLR